MEADPAKPLNNELTRRTTLEHDSSIDTIIACTVGNMSGFSGRAVSFAACYSLFALEQSTETVHFEG